MATRMDDPRGIHRERPVQVTSGSQRIKAAYERLFATPDGKMVLAHLTDTFDRRELLDDQQHRMIYRAGQRDMVLYVRLQAKVEETDDGLV